LAPGKLLKCAGRKASIVAVKVVDGYSSFKELTTTDTADEEDRGYQRHWGDRLHDLLL
jgi:hypothetical protein